MAKQRDEVGLVFDEKDLASILLNHRFPFHNVRAMLPHAKIEQPHGYVVVTLPRAVIEQNTLKKD